MILEEIVAHKRRELPARTAAVPLAELIASAGRVPGCRDLTTALQAPGVSLIAEAKRASPSKGMLRADYRPAELAAAYAANGASAISVLTDEQFFQGKIEHLMNARDVLDAADLRVPLLRKDFVFDPYQVFESRAAGADALLLIVAVLSDSQLSELLSLTRSLGMTALVEVHDETELARAMRADAGTVGINNRNLHDFSVDLGTFARLRGLLPQNVVAVAESGVRSAEDVRRLREMGADAALVGEAIVTATDIPAKVRELVQGGCV